MAKGKVVIGTPVNTSKFEGKGVKASKGQGEASLPKVGDNSGSVSKM